MIPLELGTGKNGEYRLEDFGGMKASEWEGGHPFPAQSENRRFACPAWWYQSADYEKKPKWRDCIGCDSFSGCGHFPAKDKCWERWDKEQHA